MKRSTRRRLIQGVLYAVFAAVVLFVILSADWGTIQPYFFNPDIAAAVFPGADVEALDGAGELLLRLPAAVARLVEEGVVHVLRHEREHVFLLRLSLVAREGERGGGERDHRE